MFVYGYNGFGAIKYKINKYIYKNINSNCSIHNKKLLLLRSFSII